jgi:hypothetical protein
MPYPEFGWRAPASSRLRPTKFTPERIQQIKELIARGMSCEEIAAVVGVTVGTLKVTCSRLGISLRRPKWRSGNGLLPIRGVTRVAGTATFTVIARHHGEERRTEVPLTTAMIGRLALEASSQNLSINELARNLVLAVARKQLIGRVLETDSATEDSQSGQWKDGDYDSSHAGAGKS